jgi:hypothetical protein
VATHHQDTRDHLSDKQGEFAKAARVFCSGNGFGNADLFKKQVRQTARRLRGRFGKVAAVAGAILANLTGDLRRVWQRNKLSQPMPSARKSEKEKQREELEGLLGEPVLLRDAAADAIGRTPASMKVEPHKKPPFYQKGPGTTALYPQSWIDEFKLNGKVLKPGTTTMMFGPQPWPSAPSVDPARRDRTRENLANSVDDPEYIRRVSEGDWS